MNKKQLKILDTARDLFWKHGFKRISIEEVCQKAEVSKMTFYRFFPNKVELAKAVFDREVEEGLKKFRAIMDEDAHASDKIKKMVQLKIEGTNNISREFLHDFYSNRELGLKDYIEEKTKQSWVEVLSVFRRGQEKGWFRKDMKPEFIAYVSQKMSELVVDENLLKLYSTPQELLMEFSNFFAYGISPRDESK